MKKRPLDPQNLDTAAAIITARAGETVDRIAARRATLDHVGKKDIPLVALIGESHTRPAHVLYEMQVVDGLARAGLEPVVALESESNILERAFRRACFGIKPTPKQEKLLEEEDRDGALSLTASLGLDISFDADLSKNILHNFLKRRTIPTRLNDAETCDEQYLELKNPRVLEAFNAYARTHDCLPIFIDACEPCGMAVRNIHMATIGREFAAAHKARVLVQVCGVAHIAGDVDEGGHSSEGLAAVCKAEKMAVIAFPILNRSFNAQSFPADHGLKRGEKAFIRGLPETEAIYDPKRPRSYVRGQGLAQLQTPEDEAVFVNGLLERNGMGDYALTPKGRVDLEEVNRLELFNVVDKIVQATTVSVKQMRR